MKKTVLIIILLIFGIGLGLGIGFFWGKQANINSNTDQTAEVNQNLSLNTNTTNSSDKYYCKINSDCIKTGCSGQICANQEMFSTCDVLEWYQCLEKTNCVCISNQCQWEQNDEYKSCLDDYK